MDQDFDTVDVGPIQKHLKNLYSEREYRQRYQRLDYYKPTPKQIECHNALFRRLSVRAGNRSGKTTFAAAQTAMHSLGRYPSWHQGHKFLVAPKIERSVSFNAWLIGPTGVAVRDVIQPLLIGGLTQSELGTGLIPLSALGGQILLSRGTPGLADAFEVRRDDGTLARISLKTHEMDREAFQGAAVDWTLLDEDPGKRGEEIWPELLARSIGVNGYTLHTATPLAGVSPIRQFFRDGGEDRGEVRMSLYDNTYLTPEDIKAAESQYSERERATRLFGDDLPGYGAVFNFDEASYLHDMRPEDVPDYWLWINAVDFSHFGLSSQAHPFAFISCAIDPATKILYVMHALRIKQQLPPVHVAAIRKWDAWDAPCSWGADGHQKDSSGVAFNRIYRDLGLPMRGTHAVLPTGGVNLEAQFALMETMFAQGRLKIARHLTELRTEIRDLHYNKNGEYVPENDDLASALRYAVMDMKHARMLGNSTFGGNPWARQDSNGGLCKGLDFDIFTGR